MKAVVVDAFTGGRAFKFSPRTSFESYETLSMIPSATLMHSYPNFEFSRIVVECGNCPVPEIFGPPRSREKSSIIKEVKALAGLWERKACST